MLGSEKQLDVLARIWGRDRDGYVFLPWISGSARDSASRRANYHEGRAFEWPKEADAIIEHLDAHPNDDVYFTPALFNAKRRIEQNVDSERTLWADLDPVNPSTLEEFKPTIAWETSPGRYQGVWLLNTPLTGASWPSRENHRLTLAIGADPSGWDSTQLLRVPGRRNHKPDYRGEDWQPAEGQLLWVNGPRYTWPDFEDLPTVGQEVTDLEALADESAIDAIDRHEVWGRVRLKVSGRCRELMGSRTAEGADRSDVLWEIGRELADAGCSAGEIIAILRHSVWNKYRGRNDELKRLKIGAARALASRSDEAVSEILEGDSSPKPDVVWLGDLMARPIPRPRWLVENIWTEDGCGFIAGAPKSYKSWMALDLAVSVASGTPFLGLYKVREARPVLYLQEEDDLRLVADRLEAILDQRLPEGFWQGHLRVNSGGAPKGARNPLGRPLVTWQPPSAPVTLAPMVQKGFIASDPGWQAWLADLVRENDFGLVIIDTLGTTAGDVDTDRATDLMLKILAPLKHVAKAQHTAICVVHHNRKPSNGNGSRAGMEMLGSVALHAWVDCALYAREKDPDGVVNVQREAKMAPDESFRLRVPKMYANLHTGDRQLWDPQLVPDDVSQPVEQKQQPGSRSAAGKSIALKLAACGGGPMPLDRFAEIVGGRNVEAQVESAIANGFIRRGADGLLTAV